MMDKREEFLFKMYDQMFNDIDRHHKIVWQVIGVLIGSFAFVAVAQKGIIPIDIAVALIVLLSLWVIAHVYDSNYWYNRNLVIISNIERQFLDKDDLKNIQYYFGKHRNVNAIQTSLKIQLYLAWGIIVVFIVFHFVTRILSGLSLSFKNSDIDWVRCLPYLTVIIFYIVLVRWIKNKREKNYLEFLRNSPGIEVDITGIDYGDGHPIK